MNNDIILMSIKPEYVNMILSFQKDIELRKRMPRFSVGTRVFIYSSSPDQKIVAFFTVSEKMLLSKNNLWKQYKSRLGIDREKYHRYLSTTDKACAIIISKLALIKKPISLEEIKLIDANFHPPQSYRSLDSENSITRLIMERVNG